MSHKTTLESQAKKIQELEDTNSTLKTDLQRARSSRSNEPKMKEKVAELEASVETLKQHNTQLQVGCWYMFMETISGFTSERSE